MPRKGENIYKRKDGRWEGRYIRSYNIDGKALLGYVYGKTYRDVKQKLNISKVLPQNTSRNASKIITYNELLDEWLFSKKLNVKESTYARYLHLIQAHIKPNLGKYLLSQITVKSIENFIEFQLNSGRLDGKGGLSPKTVSDMLTIIKSTLEYANINNYTTYCNLKKLTIKKKEKEMRVLTNTEQDELLKTLFKDMDLSKFGVLLSLYTGIRIGELCALKWECFNLSDSTLNIKKTMQRIQETSTATEAKTKIIISEPKSECSARIIPLPSFISDIARQFYASPQAFVLTGSESQFLEPRTMQSRFKKYVAESGIDKANFHSLRHTFATRCVEVGFEIKSLSEILGHANVNITLNRYVHSSFELKCSNMNKLKLNFKPSEKPSELCLKSHC